MQRFTLLASLCVQLIWATSAYAQTLQEIDRLWQETMDALKNGQPAKARQLFGDFNEKARAYLAANGRSWQIQYLVGSLDCQFPESRPLGARFLEDLLQNERDLNEQGRAEVKRQLAACTAPVATRSSDDTHVLGVSASTAHFQNPGVHGDMKGGSRYTVESESSLAVSPRPPSELLARRVSLAEPQKALNAALARLPSGASGAVMGHFAVTTEGPDPERALGIGRCLDAYLKPLRQQFDIQPPTYTITVYNVESTSDVYAFARRLHGLVLPRGVIAYSVAEDMSLSGTGAPGECGSMAHELVHLLIKRNFPFGPAWLEEGLASEVAVASPGADRFTFNPSWREDELQRFSGERPRIGELLELPWTAFNASSSVIERDRPVAVQAMAAVFIRYLEARGKLTDVYFAARDRHVAADLSSHASYRTIVEDQLGSGIAEVERDFNDWFARSR